MGFWWILILAVIIGIIGLAMASSRRASSSREGPEETVKRRYANGEIDRDTYEQMLADLRR
jgi:putative membrane protein